MKPRRRLRPEAGLFANGVSRKRLRQKENLMRFQFNLADGKSVADKGDEELDDAAQATEVADELATRIARERPSLVHQGYSIVVSDEEGEEVYRAKLSESVH